MTNYDIIGDVHGQGAKLRGLLELLGWKRSEGTYRHTDPSRQVIFVGDLVDRGPEQREVLTIVRAMVEAGTARIVMGNHEFNAICYATPDPAVPGEFLRKHSPKNTGQCAEFLDQLSVTERADWIAWFRTLPLWLDEQELGGLRIVHACWHEASMDVIREACGGGNVLGDDVRLYARASDSKDSLYKAVEVLLKGPEVKLASYDLPPFRDPEKNDRVNARLRWWRTSDLPLSELLDIRPPATTAAGEEYPDLSGLVLRSEDHSYAYDDQIPMVFGHHWRDWEPDEHIDWTTHAACVDFSAAKPECPLVAYRWTSGETAINPANYVCFPESTAAVSSAS
jgi:hypothetical protein